MTHCVKSMFTYVFFLDRQYNQPETQDAGTANSSVSGGFSAGYPSEIRRGIFSALNFFPFRIAYIEAFSCITVSRFAGGVMSEGCSDGGDPGAGDKLLYLLQVPSSFVCRDNHAFSDSKSHTCYSLGAPEMKGLS